MTETHSNDCAVRMSGITKTFGGLVANNAVDFEVERGTIHGLLGENGAGKTTLASILAGLLEPDGGKIEIDGKEVALRSPADAIKHGIGMVHQHFMLVETMTVAQNLALGLHQRRWPLLDLDSLSNQITDFGKNLGMYVDPKRKVSELTVGSKQRVEILKALFRGANILILDEPTAVLSSMEIEHLFGALKQLASKKKTIILIAHKMSEILSITDSVTVLRQGRNVGTRPTKRTSSLELAEMMIGKREIPGSSPTHGAKSVTAVEVRSLFVRDDRGSTRISDFGFDIASGEILGIAGIDGNGQRELAECLAGLRKPDQGSIRIAGTNVTNFDSSSMHGTGVSYIPEDRMQAVVRDLSVAENLIIKDVNDEPFSDGRILRRSQIDSNADSLIGQYGIKVQGSRSLAWTLSGGNVQRLIIARELRRKPKFLIACQPTRGLDISATKFVHQSLRNLAENGTSILLISSDLDELIELSDRILVIQAGRVTGEFAAGAYSLNEIGLRMTGVVESQKN